ncbi:probable disease resistance protein At1g61190 [Chenopodium quinoa]|uniref:probable disease resistance protein At1g61190 n=1 Tax=Chenopodium quinoa TaxID=63459 RepID=UPI000B7892E2|nr:probable disease resistance protein At1g61190 [Chenopodium quinoa]
MDWLCLAKAAGNAANETCKPIILDKLTECYSYIKNYKENKTLLETKYDLLTIAKKEIDSSVEHEVDNLRVPKEGTKRWLEDVSKLMEEVDERLVKKPKDDEERKGRDMITCLRRSRCNLCRRYDMSKEDKSKADEIDAIINRKPNDDVTEPVSRSDLKSIPNEFLKGLRSRVKLMEEILKKLRDDQVKAVGIFGMGAIGKTTLVTEISNHEEIKSMFEEIIMVEISEAPNMERIQDQIAEKIGLKLDGMHSVDQRRTKLYNRLERVSKLLIILDNLWAKLDLSKVGIPEPNKFHVEPNKFCKILVTSREKNVCEAMAISKDNVFEVTPLDYDESKQIFRARLGAKIKDNDWEDTQRVKMEKRMLNRCGGLPLAIVALADVLKNEESLEAWEHFTSELEKPMSNSLAKFRGVHRQVYSILETSYKLMEDEKKKRFFLLACLFPFGTSIPIEDMMRYGIGLELFENVDNLIKAMEQANR